MNYLKQSKMIKPTAKSCNWCKHIGLYTDSIDGEIFEHEDCWLSRLGNIKLSHRLELKMIKEESFRYCQHYRFSKDNFKKWKEEYNVNQ